MEMEHVRCNLCGADDVEVLYPSTIVWNGDLSRLERYRCTTEQYGVHHRIVRCRQCGLVYSDPRRRSVEMMEDYESVVDPCYLEQHASRRLTFHRRMEAVEALKPPVNGARLLDVGCYTGVSLEVAEERGWEAWGVEPSRWAVEEGQRRGVRVVQGTLREAEFESDFFDVVTLWDVVEHLADPKGDLAEVYRVLKPGGIAVVHTINIESWFARLMGRRWPWLVEMHLYFFSPRTLGAMVERVGFEVIEWRTEGRYLHLGYLLSRLEAYSRPLARLLVGAVRRLGGYHVAVPVNLGDLFTLYARKPGG